MEIRNSHYKIYTRKSCGKFRAVYYTLVISTHCGNFMLTYEYIITYVLPGYT